MRATGMTPETVYVDLGYCGVDKDNLGVDIKHRGKFKSMTDQEKKMLKRRQAIEPIIGHLKADHRMNRCHLKGSEGDSLHAVLCTAGDNIRCLQHDQLRFDELGDGLKVNFSGTTTYALFDPDKR